MWCFTRRRLRAFVAVAVGVSGAACATGYRNVGQAEGDLPGATVYFKNESLDQVAVYASTGGSQGFRIGTVMAGRSDTLYIPPSFVTASGGVHIYVRPLGRDATADVGPIMFRGGEALDISLPPSQHMLVVLPPRLR